MYAESIGKKIASLTLAAALLLTAQTTLAQSRVDWERQVVAATGTGIAPPTAINAAQAEMLARRAAVADAYRQLAEEVAGVQVDAESTVQNYMVMSDVVRTKVSACVQGARVLEERAIPGGAYEVTMEVPMFGVSNSLAAAVLTRNTVRQPFPAPNWGYEEDYDYAGPAVQQPAAGSSVSIEVNINQTPPLVMNAAAYGTGTYGGYGTPSSSSYSQPQSVTNPAAGQTAASKKKKKEKMPKIEGDYTSLVVDCTGLGLRPAMSPVIKNEQGEAIYGASNLDYDLVSTKGMAAYCRGLDVSGVPRAGDKPLLVKCESLSGNGVNPVLALTDANRVLLENEQSHFLDNMNVILVR